MILSGRVDIVSGSDNFHSELGNFGVLGSKAIINREKKYYPDFAAKVVGEARLLRITKELYHQVI